MEVAIYDELDSVSPPLNGVADDVGSRLPPHILAESDEAGELLNVPRPQAEACSATAEQEPERLREEAGAITWGISAVVNPHVVALDREPAKLS